VTLMTFPASSRYEQALAPEAPAQRRDGVNPASERGEDQGRDDFMRELEEQPARPLTGDEKRAAGADSGCAPTVFAPASERVSEEPLPGDREIVDHVDPSTSERRAAAAHTQTASTTTDTATAGRPAQGGPATPTQ